MTDFPGYKIHPLEKQIHAIEIISDKPVVAITLNHEKLSERDIIKEIDKIKKKVKLPVFDLLRNDADELSQLVLSEIRSKNNRKKIR